MAVNLWNDKCYIALSVEMWMEILGVAQKYGCALQGTCAPLGDCNCDNFGSIEHLVHQKNWDGNYVSCQGQLVSKMDAENIGAALKRAQLSNGIPLNEHWVQAVDYEKGGVFKFVVADWNSVIEFMEKGEFIIGKKVLFQRNRRGRSTSLSLSPKTWKSLLELVKKNGYEEADGLLKYFHAEEHSQTKKQVLSDAEGIDLAAILEDALIGTDDGEELMESLQEAGRDGAIDRIWDCVDFCKGGSFAIF